MPTFVLSLNTYDGTITGGSLLALAMVCLLQYAFHLYRQNRARQEMEQCQLQMTRMADDLRSVRKDRTLSRKENHILRQFVSEPTPDRALIVLLRHFAPDPHRGFAAFLESTSDGYTVARARGLDERSQRSIGIDDWMAERLENQRVIVVEADELHESHLMSSLSTLDRRKARTIYLAAVGEPMKPSGIWVTTSLYPEGARRSQQLELLERLMSNFAVHRHQARELAKRSDQLRSTSDMLELRSIMDSAVDAPRKMLETFLRCFAEKMGARRATVYLALPSQEQRMHRAVRGGESINSLQEQTWSEHENTLAERFSTSAELVGFDRERLADENVETLIGAALIAPIRRQDANLGLICVTREQSIAFTARELELAHWASDFLVDMLQRILKHSSIERRAREDSLTELANRQEFDLRIGEELALADSKSSVCSLLLTDLDHFKSINDRFGHLAGDEVLRVTAGCLKTVVSQLRSEDRALIARYGGEEMAVLLPGIGMAGAQRIAESIRADVEGAAVQFQDQSIQVTMSIGIASYPDHAAGVSELVAAADEALYQAKTNGRNRIESFAVESTLAVHATSS